MAARLKVEVVVEKEVVDYATADPDEVGQPIVERETPCEHRLYRKIQTDACVAYYSCATHSQGGLQTKIGRWFCSYN